MSWKLRAAMSALLLAPQVAWALGLGDIRLSSALNEPLAAEIDLVAPTADELTSLSAQLASRELFQRYGLDRPAFLDSVQFRVGQGRDGRNVLLLSSATPIAEPFLTFLVEVNWPRGRLLREYTVLLDPPVFAAAAAAPPPPVAAPRVSAPPPPPAPLAPPPERAPAPVAAAPAPRPEAAPAAAPSVPMAGGSYRVQSGDTLSGIAARLVAGERGATNRMMIALFRANPEAFGGNINLLLANSTLRVPGPDELQSIEAAEAASEIGRQTSAWRGGETTAEPARLRLVTPQEAPAEALPADATARDIEARIGRLSSEIDESRRLLDLKSSELAALQERLAREQAAAAAAPAGAAPEPAPVEAPVAAEPVAGEAPVAETAPPPREAPAPAASSGTSFVDSLTDNWSYVLGAAVLLLGGGLAYGYMRRRREEDLDEALRSFEPAASAPVPSETQRLRALAAGTAAPAAVAGAAVAPASDGTLELPKLKPSFAPGLTVQDDTISVDEPRDIDRADALAEADFHMAYGLYDQAADIVKLALKREPGRSDFNMKLLEIYFVSGNKERFLDAAREVDMTRSVAGAADWDRVVIMGRQLAPEDPLFVGAAIGSSVDLNLEGGASRVDLELLGPPIGDEGIDFDLGQAFEAKPSLEATGENELLDFDLGSPEPPTAEMPQFRDGTAEMPTVEMMTGDAPTVEATMLKTGAADTLLQKVERAGLTAVQPATDQTAEMPVDDLGIDIGDFGDFDLPDDVTSVAAADDDVASQNTAEMPKLSEDMDFDLTELSAGLDVAAETQRATLDLDVGADMATREDEFTATEQMSLADFPELSELEPVTMSEVGTKLDLARAYVDMGDPEGARSILQEVLGEGSPSQRQEAQRLIDGLPGA